MKSGFTLIELSIVLVIIGLITGGVLTGRDLINAATARAQVTQIERYNTAVHTFQNKYGYLPGDIPNPYASNFGFQSRGQYGGEGDGNGIIEGVASNTPATNYGWDEVCGETTTLWVDLSTANLIDAGLSAASSTTASNGCTGSVTLSAYYPPAKVGVGNYLYVWSGGMNAIATSNGINYFAIAALTGIDGSGYLAQNPGLSVIQAYNIDKKMDDGYPQTGSVTATYLNNTWGTRAAWAAGGGTEGTADMSATAGSSTTCYDKSNTGGAVQKYSVGQNGGSNVNCALSFRFQ